MQDIKKKKRLQNEDKTLYNAHLGYLVTKLNVKSLDPAYENVKYYIHFGKKQSQGKQWYFFFKKKYTAQH